MIVVDASVLANALADGGPDGAAARARLRADYDVHAPELIDLEVVSVLRRRVAARDLPQEEAEASIADLRGMPLRRYPHAAFLARIWSLRENLTPYDAAYAALAEALGCPLVTADRSMAEAPGLACPVELLRR